MNKIVFMGTPDFSVDSLELLFKEGFEIDLVITQPDRPGHRKKMTPTPVKLKAEELGLSIRTPENVNDKEIVDLIRESNPDFIVVVAFGQKIGREFLDLYEDRIINVHSSLLPKYRGAAPINWAIIEGEKVSGASIMLIDEKLDRGDVLKTTTVDIQEEDTAVELEKKIKEIGAIALVDVLKNFDQYYENREVQIEEEASYRGYLTKKMGEISWSDSAQVIYNKFRGLQPWPGVYFIYEGENIKVHKMNIIENYNDYKEGQVLEVNEDNIRIGTSEGVVEIKEFQFPGKKRMTVEQYLVGNSFPKGILL